MKNEVHDLTYENEIAELEKMEKDLSKTPILPDLVKVLAKFPTVRQMHKMFSDTLAKINFPEVQKVEGSVDVEFPEVQRVEVTNPVQPARVVKAVVDFPDTQKVVGVVKVEGINKLQKAVENLTEIMTSKPDPEALPEVMKVDVQNWQHVESVGGGGAPANIMNKDKIWIREEFTYDGAGNVTRAEKWDGSIKLTQDFEYDGSNNVVVTSSRVESSDTPGA